MNEQLVQSFKSLQEMHLQRISLLKQITLNGPEDEQIILQQQKELKDLFKKSKKVFNKQQLRFQLKDATKAEPQTNYYSYQFDTKEKAEGLPEEIAKAEKKEEMLVYDENITSYTLNVLVDNTLNVNVDSDPESQNLYGSYVNETILTEPDNKDTDNQNLYGSYSETSLDASSLNWSEDEQDDVRETERELSEWDKNLYQVLHSDDNKDNFGIVATIGDHFKNAAETIGKMIIAEQHVPNKEKKIKVLDDVGGFAGGSKFKAHGLFFKYPVDVSLSKNTWLYGHSSCDDMLAAKASNHDLKGFSYLMRVDTDSLFNYPLFSLFDFQGYRLMIMTELPISKSPQTLVYGSGDAGKTVFHDPSIHSKMEQIAKKLNLREHAVATSKAPMFLCGDIEVHEFQNESKPTLYVLDTARIFPPTFTQRPGVAFYRLFRPEFVEKYERPLVSDALSNWLTDDNKYTMNMDVMTATEILKSKVKLFAKQLFDNKQLFKIIKSTKTRISKINPDDSYFYNPLIERIHEEGINIRYLGCFFLSLIELNVKEEVLTLVLSVILSRVLKNNWKENIRKKNQTSRVYDICLYESIKSLDLVISIKNKSITEKELLEKWQDIFKKSRSMFVVEIMTPEEETTFTTLLKGKLTSISTQDTIFLFSKLCGIVLNRSTISAINSNFYFKFGQADITRFVPVLKIQPIINYYSGIYFYNMAKSIDISVTQTRFNYFANAGYKFLSIINIGYKKTRKYCAKTFTEALKLGQDVDCDIELILSIFRDVLDHNKGLDGVKFVKYYLYYMTCFFWKILGKEAKDKEIDINHEIDSHLDYLKQNGTTSAKSLYCAMNTQQQAQIIGIYFDSQLKIWKKEKYIQTKNLLKEKKSQLISRHELLEQHTKKFEKLLKNDNEAQNYMIDFIFNSKYWPIDIHQKANFFQMILRMKTLSLISIKIPEKNLKEYWTTIFVNPLLHALFHESSLYELLHSQKINDEHFKHFLTKSYSDEKRSIVHSSALDRFKSLLDQNDIPLQDLVDNEGNTALHFWSRELCDIYSISSHQSKEWFLSSAHMNAYDFEPFSLEKVIDIKGLLQSKSFYRLGEKVTTTIEIKDPYPNTKILKFLLGVNIDINLQNKSDKCTALHVAARNGHTSIVELLLAANANNKVRNSSGQTPLHMAIENGCSNVANLLISGRADIEALQGDQSTPLHVACKNGKLEIVNILLSNNAKIDVFNENQLSPVHISLAHGRFDCALHLVKAGAVLTELDINTMTRNIGPLVQFIKDSTFDELNGNFRCSVVHLLVSTNEFPSTEIEKVKKLYDLEFSDPKITRKMMDVAVYLFQKDPQLMNWLDRDKFTKRVEQQQVHEHVANWIPWLKANLNKENLGQLPKFHITLTDADHADVTPDGLRCKSRLTSYFMTVRANKFMSQGKWYFEITLLTAGLMQIGYITTQFNYDRSRQRGVGDYAGSWAIDLYRNFKWHKAQSSPYGVTKWKPNTILQCLLDLDNRILSFIYEGNEEVAFRDIEIDNGLTPAISTSAGEEVIFNFGVKQFKYEIPTGFLPLELAG